MISHMYNMLLLSGTFPEPLLNRPYKTTEKVAQNQSNS